MINSGNADQFEGKTVTGKLTNTKSNQFVIDGVTLNLTIQDLEIVITGFPGLGSGLTLKNGATLHLTLLGDNTLTGAYGGAGINVPEGCTLNITAASTGALTATGGNNYGGGAGIGAVGDQTNFENNNTVIASVGTINIAGGTVTARGGTQYFKDGAPLGGAAGIGGSNGGTTGVIHITGGKIVASGGCYAAGIGGGETGRVK